MKSASSNMADEEIFKLFDPLWADLQEFDSFPTKAAVSGALHVDLRARGYPPKQRNMVF